MDGLDDQVIEAAQRSHPLGAGHDEASGGVSNPNLPKQPPFVGVLPAPRTPVRELTFGEQDLGSLRRALSEWSAQELLGTDATQELVLAVNELATNSIRYGGGQGKALLWREDDTLLCEIQDAGHIADPLAGRAPASPDQHTGRGLWLVRELCDAVQIRSSAHGTAIRVHKQLAGAAEG